MAWDECLSESKVKQASKDLNLIKACLSMSERWIKSINYLPNNSDNASIIVSNAYSALLEVLIALLSLKGFKSYSHECLTYFLREVLDEEKMSIVFERNRKLRNGINYYGRDVSPERAEQALKEIKSLINALRRKYFLVR